MGSNRYMCIWITHILDVFRTNSKTIYKSEIDLIRKGKRDFMDKSCFYLFCVVLPSLGGRRFYGGKIFRNLSDHFRFFPMCFFELRFKNSNLNIQILLYNSFKLGFNKSKILSWKGLSWSWDKILFVFASIILIYFLTHPFSPFHYIFQKTKVRVENGIVDERASYHDNSSLKHWIAGVTPETHPWAMYAIRISSKNRLKSTNSNLNLFDRKQFY